MKFSKKPPILGMFRHACPMTRRDGRMIRVETCPGEILFGIGPGYLVGTGSNLPRKAVRGEKNEQALPSRKCIRTGSVPYRTVYVFFCRVALIPVIVSKVLKTLRTCISRVPARRRRPFRRAGCRVSCDRSNASGHPPQSDRPSVKSNTLTPCHKIMKGSRRLCAFGGVLSLALLLTLAFSGTALAQTAIDLDQKASLHGAVHATNLRITDASGDSLGTVFCRPASVCQRRHYQQTERKSAVCICRTCAGFQRCRTRARLDHLRAGSGTVIQSIFCMGAHLCGDVHGYCVCHRVS